MGQNVIVSFFWAGGGVLFFFESAFRCLTSFVLSQPTSIKVILTDTRSGGSVDSAYGINDGTIFVFFVCFFKESAGKSARMP